jgi:hypothetical protein
MMKYYNRNIILFPFYSTHFNDSYNRGGINLCTIFEMPSHILCQTSIPFHEYRKYVISNCTQVGNTLNKQQSLLLQSIDNEQLIHSSIAKFDFSTGHCILGSAWEWNGFKIKDQAPAIKTHVRVTAKYKLMLQAARSFLGISTKSPLVVIHWRRGDQLKSRCKWKHFRDVSVNCGNVSSFIDFALNKIRKANIATTTVVYIATNEHRYAILQELRDAGFKVGLEGIRIHLSAVDAYVLDLLLMATASIFVPVGRSNVNTFVDRLRGGNYIY